jgi:hypothetical protein
MKLPAIISVFLATLITACAPVQTSETSTDSAATQSSKHTAFQGTLMAIDLSAHTVTIQTDHGTMTMAFDENTKFDYRGGSKTLSDFNVGEKVSGMFMMDDSGKMMAILIKPYNSKE